MIVDAALALRSKPIFFVPISIAYERIIEERSFVRELGGGEKEREDLGTLLKAPRVFRSRYGRLYIEFGEIFSFHESIREATPAAATLAAGRPQLAPKQRRTLIQNIAHRAVREIHRATVVTPASLVASALLAHRRRGMTHRELLEASSSLLASAKRFGARVTRPVVDAQGELSERAVEEAIGLFIDARLLVRHGDGADAIYRVPGERRIALEYYKNNILHFFAPNALVATGLLADAAEPVSEAALRARFEDLSQLFEHEFISRTPGDDQDFERLIEGMIAAGEIERMGDVLRPGAGRAGGRLSLYAGFLRGYFESYRLALRGLHTVSEVEIPIKDWTKRTLALGHRMYLAGELEKREALSRHKLENVLKALHDRGIVRVRSNGQFSRVTEAEADEKLRALESRLLSYTS
jgi:glycerol-3-phosphate O-acyltransferase